MKKSVHTNLSAFLYEQSLISSRPLWMSDNNREHPVKVAPISNLLLKHSVYCSTGFTEREDQEIKDGAVEYLTDISKILGKIPREMLLVLKTNDQLRGLEV